MHRPNAPDHSQGFLDIRDLKLIGEGRTAQVFLLHDDSVMKLYRTNVPQAAIDNEFLVCRAIGRVMDVPGVRDRVVVSGREAVVFDRIVGRSGFARILSSPWNIRSLAREFASLHAQMHAITMPDGVPDLSNVLLRNMYLHDLLSADATSQIADYLRKLPEEKKLCHGDFHPGNVVFDGCKSFVIDWMTATRGSPAADVARTSVLLKWADPGPGIPRLLTPILQAVRKRFLDYYLIEYVRLTSVPRMEIEAWELPVLAARLMEWLPPSEKERILAIIKTKLTNS